MLEVKTSKERKTRGKKKLKKQNEAILEVQFEMPTDFKFEKAKEKNYKG